MHSATMNLPPQLFKLWINSFEENEQDLIVYRPEEFPFPPARNSGNLGI